MLASFVQNFNLQNKIFDIFDKNVNRDNFGYFYYMLKTTFESKDINLSTCDINKPENSPIVIYNGLQQNFINYGEEKSYLLAIESPHVDPKSFDPSFHKFFKKVFTWDDDLVDNKKYFKVNYAFDIPKEIPKKFEGKKFCCTIAGYKYANDPDELYTHRVKLIQWFEKNHLEEFDLYGMGWDNKKFPPGVFSRLLNKSKLMKKFFGPTFLSYKGKVDSKKEVMEKYKFAICYENIKDQNGYITEKIFDCFFAGCVPIYWGAKNISEYIPKECFIDKREFGSFEELYSFLKSIDEDQYQNYLEAIEEFLNSSKADPFRATTFANTIVDEITKDIS